MRHQPSIPDNIRHWQVFERDQQIKIFLEMINEFFSTHIDQDIEEENQDIEWDPEWKNMIVNHKIMQLKNNFIPK